MVEIGELIRYEVDASSSSSEGQSWTPNHGLVDKVRGSGDVTIFKSVGVGVQDVAIASAVVTKATASGVGTTLQL